MAENKDEQTEDLQVVDEAALSEMAELYEQAPQQTHANPMPDRSREIPALLETDPPDEPQMEAAAISAANEDSSEETPEEPAPAAAEAETAAIRYLESPTTSAELSAIRSDLTALRETLQGFQNSSQQMAARLDGIAGDTGALTGKANEIALNHELVSAELESLVSGSGSRNVLSRGFLICTCCVIVLLAAFQLYTFISLIRTENLQQTSGSKILEDFKALDKKLTQYTATLPAATSTAGHAESQQPHAAPATHGTPAAHGQSAPATGHQPGAATGTSHDAHTPQPASHASQIPLSEKLNRLRNGQTEKKLVRKESGDWFVYAKKAEECIADSEVIEALNQAYKRLGRPLTTSTPLPAHNSLCILKPDGKGGTEIVMTKNFVP